MNGHVELWAWDGTIWRKVIVDAAGHLQIDVLTSALPAGAATAANQATMITALQIIDDMEVKCYGWDGAAWQTLLVESAALKNLRAKLYDGANGIGSHLTDTTALAVGERGLVTKSQITGWSGLPFLQIGNDYDGVAASATAIRMCNISHLYGYNGATWDRLRSDAAYNLQVDVNEVRKTDTATIAQVSVGVASTAVLAANANRILAEFVNDSANVIYLALGTPAVMNRGIRLNANGGSFEIGLTNLYTGAVTAISGVAASNLTVSEG